MPSCPRIRVRGSGGNVNWPALPPQQVAERLNLDTVAVQALESDDYAALGAPVFVRGHIRRYSTLLGLPGEEVLGAYDRSRAQLAPPTLVPKSRAEMAPPRRRVIPPWVVAGALVLIVAAGVVAYVSEFGLHLPDAGGAGVDARGNQWRPSVQVRRPGTQTAAPGSSEAAGQGGSASQANPATPGVEASAAVPPGQVELLFAFAADSWIEVYDGSGRPCSTISARPGPSALSQVSPRSA